MHPLSYAQSPRRARGVHGLPKADNGLLGIVKRTPLWVCGVIALILIGDIIIFADFFSPAAKEESQVPRSDFHRIVHASPAVLPQTGAGHQQGKGRYALTCSCLPHGDAPSAIITCSIGPTGAMSTRIANRERQGVPLFKCARTDDGESCRCCDCGVERRELQLSAPDLRRLGSCPECERPSPAEPGPGGADGGGGGGGGGADDSADKAVVFKPGGHEHAILFKVPLGVAYDFGAFRVELIVDGDFSKSADNDPIVGLMDANGGLAVASRAEGGEGAQQGTVWAAQRGDNGLWFSIGKYARHEAQAPDASSGDPGEPARGVYEPYSMHFEKHGSRASRYGMTIHHSTHGKGNTFFTMDNDMMDHGGKYDRVGAWRKPGWPAAGNATALYLVAFRDDSAEHYEFKRVIVRYEKINNERKP